MQGCRRLTALLCVVLFPYSALALEVGAETGPADRVRQCEQAGVSPELLLPLLEKPLYAGRVNSASRRSTPTSGGCTWRSPTCVAAWFTSAGRT